MDEPSRYHANPKLISVTTSNVWASHAPPEAPHFCAIRAKAAEAQIRETQANPWMQDVLQSEWPTRSSKGSRSWTVEGGWGPGEKSEPGGLGATAWRVLWGLDWTVDQKDMRGRAGENRRGPVLQWLACSNADFLASTSVLWLCRIVTLGTWVVQSLGMALTCRFFYTFIVST